jgi:hypothetical protein
LFGGDFILFLAENFTTTTTKKDSGNFGSQKTRGTEKMVGGGGGGGGGEDEEFALHKEEAPTNKRRRRRRRRRRGRKCKCHHHQEWPFNEKTPTTLGPVPSPPRIRSRFSPPIYKSRQVKRKENKKRKNTHERVGEFNLVRSSFSSLPPPPSSTY